MSSNSRGKQPRVSFGWKKGNPVEESVKSAHDTELRKWINTKGTRRVVVMQTHHTVQCNGGFTFQVLLFPVSSFLSPPLSPSSRGFLIFNSRSTMSFTAFFWPALPRKRNWRACIKYRDSSRVPLL